MIKRLQLINQQCKGAGCLLKCDLQRTGVFSGTVWSDLTEDAELGDCPSSSLLMKPQVKNHLIGII